MRVSFYTNKSDARVLSKNLSLLATVDAQLKESCDILRPRLVLARRSLSQYATCNYCIIPSLKRNYFCEITMLAGDMLEITCSVDVASTWASSIRNLYCTILRQEKIFNKFIPDATLPIRMTRNIQYVAIGDYNAGTGLYLTVDGGKDNVSGEE